MRIPNKLIVACAAIGLAAALASPAAAQDIANPVGITFNGLSSQWNLSIGTQVVHSDQSSTGQIASVVGGAVTIAPVKESVKYTNFLPSV